MRRSKLMRNLMRTGLAISLAALTATFFVHGGRDFRFALTIVTLGFTIAVTVIERRKES